MTVTAAFCPLSLQTLFDQTGLPIGGAKFYFYDAGTTTARTVYRDSGLVLEYPTPVSADAFGRVPVIFVGVGDYKIVARNASGTFLFQADGLPGGTTVSAGGTTTTNYWSTGDLKPTYIPVGQDGFLLANGKTIGNEISAGTARANADCSALFTGLWNADSTLAVSGGRGANATADWGAAKTIALPSLRGRTLVGCDGMGNSLAGVLNVFTNPDKLGSIGGAETITLTAAQIAAHNHGVTVNAGGGHTPTGTIASAAAHTHTGTTAGIGDHQHGIGTLNGATNGSSAATVGGVTPTAATNAAGAHSHTFTTDTGGAHIHTFTGDAVADHVHTATSANAGGDGSHSNMQPTILVYFLIKI